MRLDEGHKDVGYTIGEIWQESIRGSCFECASRLCWRSFAARSSSSRCDKLQVASICENRQTASAEPCLGLTGVRA